jgi:DNA-binding NarL/FixJ family response regulator
MTQLGKRQRATRSPTIAAAANRDSDPSANAKSLANSRLARLRITAAEERVLRWIARGKTNKEIAAVLGISPATVKRHVEKILPKLGLRNRVEVAIFGLALDGCPHQSGTHCALRQVEFV